MNENALCNANHFQSVVFQMIWNSVLLVDVLFHFFSMFVAKPVFLCTCLMMTQCHLLLNKVEQSKNMFTTVTIASYTFTFTS